jgi:hypothetical protein
VELSQSTSPPSACHAQRFGLAVEHQLAVLVADGCPGRDLAGAVRRRMMAKIKIKIKIVVSNGPWFHHHR